MSLQKPRALPAPSRMLLLAAAMTVAGASSSFAQTSARPDTAAIVIHRDAGCFLPGVDENGGIIAPGGYGWMWQKVENGNQVTMHCRGGTTNLSGKTTQLRGFSCGIFTPEGPFVYTTDTHCTITAKGYCTMACTYTKR